MEKLWVDEYRSEIIYLKSKVWLLHSKIYLPAKGYVKYTLSLITGTSTQWTSLLPMPNKTLSLFKFKFEIDNVLSLPFYFMFAFSSIRKLSPHRVNKGRSLMMEPGILLPLPCCGLVSPVFI